MHKWRNSPMVLVPMFIPFFLIYFIYHFWQSKTHTLPTYGTFWSRSKSVFYQNDPSGPFRYFTALILFLRSFTAVMIPVGVSLSTYFCKMIHVSPAVVQSFSTMSAFTTALLFFKLYNERLNRQHIVGMLMIVGSVMIVAVCKSLQMSRQENDVYLTALEMDDVSKQEVKKGVEE